MKIIKPDIACKKPKVYAIRIELPRFLDNPIVKLIPCPRMGDKFYADLFIEERHES